MTDVSQVLGCSSYHTISRIERNERTPSLEMVIGYHLLFGTPVTELLPPEFDAYSSGIRERVKARVLELRAQEQTPFVRSRIAQLEALIK